MASEIDRPSTKGHVPICAIGASAGGVHALRSLFRQLPDDLGLAYVVIVHLAPEHPSALAEVLSTCTKMDVHQVTDTPELRPNCIYVIPPDRELVIEGDSVHARAFTEPRGRRAPVDVFFRSIAAARGDGMAVVLSGAGADGSNGVRAIQEAGGVVFAQEPCRGRIRRDAAERHRHRRRQLHRADRPPGGAHRGGGEEQGSGALARRGRRGQRPAPHRRLSARAHGPRLLELQARDGDAPGAAPHAGLPDHQPGGICRVRPHHTRGGA